MTPTPSNEPGAADNRLSLDPATYDFTQEWGDGEEYTLTVKVRQVSPGEFEVVSAEESGAAEAPEGEDTEDTGSEEEGMNMPDVAPSGMMKGMGGSKNPAVARLMRGKNG